MDKKWDKATMPCYSSNKDYNQYIKKLLKSSFWEFYNNRKPKHAYLIFTPTQQKIPVPGSPKGDPAGLKNFKSAINRLYKNYNKNLH